VVHAFTQKTYGCISLPSSCSFSKHNHVVQDHAKWALSVTHMDTPAATTLHSVVTFCGSCCVTATLQLWDAACGQGDEQENRN